jgi:hypothetical protein
MLISHSIAIVPVMRATSFLQGILVTLIRHTRRTSNIPTYKCPCHISRATARRRRRATKGQLHFPSCRCRHLVCNLSGEFNCLGLRYAAALPRHVISMPGRLTATGVSKVVFWRCFGNAACAFLHRIHPQHLVIFSPGGHRRGEQRSVRATEKQVLCADGRRGEGANAARSPQDDDRCRGVQRQGAGVAVAAGMALAGAGQGCGRGWVLVHHGIARAGFLRRQRCRELASVVLVV